MGDRVIWRWNQRMVRREWRQLAAIALLIAMSVSIGVGAVLAAYNLPGPRSQPEVSLQSISTGEIAEARNAIAAVHLSDELMGYVLDIAAATRDSTHVNLGLSTRGALALAR